MRESLDKNVRNKDLFGVAQVRLFEIGTVWRDDIESVWLCVGVEKMKQMESAQDVLLSLGEYLGITVASDPLNADVLEIPLAAIIADLPQPESYEQLPLDTDVRYVPFSRYPFIVRDIALWVQTGTSPEEVRAVIANASGELLFRITQFDQFEKEGRISLAFRLVFQSADRSLTDGDVSERMGSVNAAVAAKGWEVR